MSYYTLQFTLPSARCVANSRPIFPLFNDLFPDVMLHYVLRVMVSKVESRKRGR